MNPWKREGLSYVARLQTVGRFGNGTLKLKLSFIAYHLIKWYHGEEGLVKMAERARKRYE